MKKFLSVILALLIGIVPVGVMAEESDAVFIEMDFDSQSQQDLNSFEPFYNTKMEFVNGLSGKGLAISNPDDLSLTRLNFGKATSGILSIRQAVCIRNSKEAQIRVMAEGKSLFALIFNNKQIKAMGKNGYVKIRGYEENTWYNVELVINTSACNYEVRINGIKAGGTLNYSVKDKPDSVQYSAAGSSSKMVIDDILVTSGEIITGVPTTAGSGTTSLPNAGGEDDEEYIREAYYSSREERLDYYKFPDEEYIPGIHSVGEVGASTQTEEFPATNAIDGDDSTRWQAAPPEKPIDNGKSMRLLKPEIGNGTLAMQYTFTPCKGTVTIEQDVMVTDVSYEKALPYIYSSSGKTSVSLIQSGGVFKCAGGGGTVLRDVAADRWYSIKMVMNFDSQSYDVYVDGKLCLAGQSFREECEDATRLRYHVNQRQTGGLYLDNLKISYSSPLQSFEEIVTQEDFESYAEGTEKLPGWGIGKASGGKIDIGTYIAPSLYTFPQSIFINLVRESEVEGVSLKIPDGVSLKYTVDVDRSGGTVYKTVQDKTDKFYSGEQTLSFAPVHATHVRITIFDAIDAMGNTTYAQIAEYKVILKRRTPVDNLAFSADVAVSGENSVKYDKRGINDNIIAEFGKIGEWQSGNESEKWVELSWSEPQTINRIILHDSAKYEDWTKAGVLTFSDGSSINVTGIKNTGYPCDITFEPKTVTSVRFTITDYEGGAALSEFQVFAPGGKPEDIEYVEPIITFYADPLYQSRWVNINDVDNDGEVEFISARIYDDPLFGGNHECASIAVQEADGTILWTWGEPERGAKAMGSDIPCQVHDIDNDGQEEVVAATHDYLYIFNGRNGEVEKRYPMPSSKYEAGSWASDTIIFADISGKGYASDIMVKTRYTEVWAYTYDWELLWYTCMPAGMKVGHYPQPIDIDNDAKDEVIVGFSCIDDNGDIMWSMKEKEYGGFLSRGHKDSLDVINFVLTGDTTGDHIINQKDIDLVNKHIAGEITLSGNQFTAGDTTGDGVINDEDKILIEERISGVIKPFPNKGIPKKDERYFISPCGGASNLIMFDGNGDRVWALDDAVHYETVEKANLGLDDNPFQLVSGDNAISGPNAQLMYLSLDGEILNIANSYVRNRQFNPINWTGEGGIDYIFMPTDNVLVDGHFKTRVKPLCPVRGYDSTSMKSYQTGSKKFTCDVDGDGTTDIGTICNENGTIAVYLWPNHNGAKVADGIGRGYNISQY